MNYSIFNGKLFHGRRIKHNNNNNNDLKVLKGVGLFSQQVCMHNHLCQTTSGFLKFYESHPLDNAHKILRPFVPRTVLKKRLKK